jgi:DNA repair protein RadC
MGGFFLIKNINMKNNLLQLAEIKISYQPKIQASDRIKVKASKDAAMAFRQVWEYPLELKECFYTLYLNRNNQILGYLLVSVGGISGTVMDVRNIMQTALKANACSIMPTIIHQEIWILLIQIKTHSSSQECRNIA